MRHALRSLALALLVLSCATPPRAWQAPDDDYGRALEQATRSTTIYKGIDPALMIYATWESAAFVEARRQRVATEFRVPAAEADQRGGEVTRPTDGPTFLVAVHTSQREWNDLERPDSTWQLSLKPSAVRPALVRRLDGRNSTLRALYPYVGPFFSAYRVVFPPGQLPGAPTLVVSGPLGEGTLAF